MKRTTEVTYETEELVSVKVRDGFTGFCERCNAVVEMLPPEAAALLTGLGEREIFRLIETGEIHFVEAERVFVCRDSSMNRSKLLPMALGEGKWLKAEPSSIGRVSDQTNEGEKDAYDS